MVMIVMYLILINSKNVSTIEGKKIYFIEVFFIFFPEKNCQGQIKRRLTEPFYD